MQILFICCFCTVWILRFPSENLPCVLQSQKAVGHNPLSTWVTQNYSNNFNWEKLKPKSFLLHSVRPMWTLLKVTPKSETLDLIILCLCSLSGGFTHPVTLTHESTPRGWDETRVSYTAFSPCAEVISDLCLWLWVVPVNSWGLHCLVMSQESCKSQQAVFPSNEVIWLFCMVHLNCKGVLHKLPKLHISF